MERQALPRPKVWLIHSRNSPERTSRWHDVRNDVHHGHNILKSQSHAGGTGGGGAGSGGGGRLQLNEGSLPSKAP
jgi:hypothetical protein